MVQGLRKKLQVPDDEESLEEVDLRLATLREDNRAVLAELRNVAAMEPMIAGALEAAGIRLSSGGAGSGPPSRAGSNGSSRGSSRGSETSSRGGGTAVHPRQVSGVRR